MPNRRTVLFDSHVAKSARMVPFAGWDMPVQYAGIIEEHTAVRNTVGLFDVSHMARLTFAGPEALNLLETVFTNRVSTLKDDQVRYGVLCNPDGGTIDDVLVYKRSDGYAMVANGANREKVVNHLNTVSGKYAVAIHDETEETALIAIQGPKAVSLLAGMFADDLSKVKYYFSKDTTFCGVPCHVSRTGYTGEDGFEVWIRNDSAVAVWDELLGRGAVPCGLGARDTLRLEAGMPLYGHELLDTFDPIQAGLGWAVKLDKDFLGKQSLQNLPADRPVRVGLRLTEKRAARQGCPILLDAGTPVGLVTSGSFCPTVNASIAMGFVSPRHATPGTDLLIDVRGSHLSATVVPLPFYSRPV